MLIFLSYRCRVGRIARCRCGARDRGSQSTTNSGLRFLAGGQPGFSCTQCGGGHRLGTIHGSARQLTSQSMSVTREGFIQQLAASRLMTEGEVAMTAGSLAPVG